MKSHKKPPYLLFLVLIFADVMALVFEKIASIHASGVGIEFYLDLAKHPWMWIGLGFGPIQLWAWVKILGRTELSLAYPLASLSYPATMLIAQFFLGENLTARAWLGALLIMSGVIIIGSKRKDNVIIAL